MSLHRTLIEASLHVDTEMCARLAAREDLPAEMTDLLRRLVECVDASRRLIARIDGGSLLAENAGREIDAKVEEMLEIFEKLSGLLTDTHSEIAGILRGAAWN